LSRVVRYGLSRLGVASLLAAASLPVTAVTATPESAKSATFYCSQVLVPAYTRCAYDLNVGSYSYNNNQSYAYKGPGIPVCENVHLYGQTSNISRRCGGSPVDSLCDLNSYWGNAFTFYTGNNAGAPVIMDGKGSSVVCD
jgi:hypothetical protein